MLQGCPHVNAVGQSVVYQIVCRKGLRGCWRPLVDVLGTLDWEQDLLAEVAIGA